MADENRVTRAPRLVVVATPIGNLDDLSPRAEAALREADLIACEDTRRTRVLAERAGSRAELIALHRHSERARTETVLQRARRGEAVVLVSDAGTPVVSDPGALLIAAAHAADLPVQVIPGPSAVTAAVAASGFAGDAFAFVGFLPRKRGDLERLLDAHDRLGVALVGFESPNRLRRTLEWLAARDSGRGVAICRELTKLHEQIVRASAAAALEMLDAEPRGEVTLVLEPVDAVEAPTDLTPGLELLARAGVGPRASAEIVAALGAGAKNAAYEAALDLLRDAESGP